MNQDNQTGFFGQYVIACFHPSQYKTLLQNKIKSVIGYLSFLIILLVCLESVIPFAAWDASVGGFENLILNRIPAFSLEKGILTMEAPVEFELGQVIHVKIDTSQASYGENDFAQEYVEEVLISRSNIMMKNAGETQNISLNNLGNFVLNNKNLAMMIPGIYLSLGLYLIILILSKTVQYLFTAVMFALICRAGVRTAEGKVVSMTEAFLSALYAKTLFALLTSLNVCLGYVVNSTVLMCVAIMVTINFVFRAEMSLLKPKIS